MLVELGDKQYEAEFKSNIPVEIRIAGLVLFQMISYVLAKQLFQKTGIDHTGNTRVENTDTTNVKMKGPDISDLNL